MLPGSRRTEMTYDHNSTQKDELKTTTGFSPDVLIFGQEGEGCLSEAFRCGRQVCCPFEPFPSWI